MRVTVTVVEINSHLLSYLTPPTETIHRTVINPYAVPYDAPKPPSSSTPPSAPSYGALAHSSLKKTNRREDVKVERSKKDNNETLNLLKQYL
ncbi:hypothetical protein HID58_085570, partial [Brassica napus]